MARRVLLLALAGRCLGQAGSSCAIANRSLYIVGGQVDDHPYNAILTVDLTVPFAVKNFTTGSPHVSVFPVAGEAYVPSYGTLFTTGANDAKLWAFGSLGDTPLGLRYFDLARSEWEPALTTTLGPTPRSAFAWAHHDDTQFLLGGIANRSLANDFWQLRAGYMGSWKQLPTPATPPAQHHQAVVVNGQLVVLGGQLADGSVRDLGEVWVFDLARGAWSVQATVGGKGFPMVKFTPLAYNNSVVFQGGASGLDPKAPDYRLYSQLFILDTADWTWRISDPKPNTTARAAYAAVIVENQLVQFLGEVGDGGNPLVQVISLLDATVAETYRPPPLAWFDTLHAPDQRQQGVSSDIVVAIVAAILATILLPMLVVSLVRRRRAKIYLKKHPPPPNNPRPAYRPHRPKPEPKPAPSAEPSPTLTDPQSPLADTPLLATRTSTTAPKRPISQISLKSP